MKKWVIIIIIVIVALLAIGILHDAGYLNFQSKTLTMLFAALAGPYMFIKNKLFNRNSPESVEEIVNRAKDGLIKDDEHREDYDNKIAQKEKEINSLNAQLNSLDLKLKEMETKTQTVSAQVREMTTEEITKEFEKLYGNEKDD
jgi:chromosome segregation ATPase